MAETVYGGKYDVIVAGGGPGGLPAAIAAARAGMKTLLLEQHAMLGGLTVSSMPLLGYVDRAGRLVLGGIANEIVTRLQEKKASRGHVTDPTSASLTLINANWMRILACEMCDEAGVDARLYSRLTDVKVENGRVVGVTACQIEQHVYYETAMLIDATGNGTAMHFAGAHYERNQILMPGSLEFAIGNVDIDAFLRFLEENPEDAKLPDTYTVTQSMEQMYNRNGFGVTGLMKSIETARANGEYIIPRDCAVLVTTNEKDEIHCNTTRVINVDPTDTLSVTRAEFEAHKQVESLMHFFRKYIGGFANCTLNYIAPFFGIRETRRIKGIKQLNGDDVKNCRVPKDSIAMAGYNFDVHVPGKVTTVIQPVEKAVGIPYGCLVSENIDGLLVSGRCIAATDEAYGLTRVMGTCMGVGEAAGTAAALCVKKGIQPRELCPEELRAELKKNGAIVE